MKWSWWMEHPAGLLAVGHARSDSDVWVIVEESFEGRDWKHALLRVNGLLPLLASTWEPVGQIPSGRLWPTMNGLDQICRAWAGQKSPGSSSRECEQASMGAGTNACSDCGGLEWPGAFGSPAWMVGECVVGVDNTEEG